MGDKSTRDYSIIMAKTKIQKAGGKTTGGRMGRRYSYNTESPSGNAWNASGTHCLVWDFAANDDDDRRAAIADILGRVEQGYSPCDGEDCEYCNPSPE